MVRVENQGGMVRDKRSAIPLRMPAVERVAAPGWARQFAVVAADRDVNGNLLDAPAIGVETNFIRQNAPLRVQGLVRAEIDNRIGGDFRAGRVAPAVERVALALWNGQFPVGAAIRDGFAFRLDGSAVAGQKRNGIGRGVRGGVWLGGAVLRDNAVQYMPLNDRRFLFLQRAVHDMPLKNSKALRVRQQGKRH